MLKDQVLDQVDLKIKLDLVQEQDQNQDLNLVLKKIKDLKNHLVVLTKVKEEKEKRELRVVDQKVPD